MPLIEVDLLIAYFDSHHRFHARAVSFMEDDVIPSRGEYAVSPFALQELEIGLKGGSILLRGKRASTDTEIAAFLSEMCTAFDVHRLAIQPMTCEMFSKAADCRSRFGLAYFDSLHAAAASMVPDKTLVSGDLGYKRVTDLRLVDPFR